MLMNGHDKMKGLSQIKASPKSGQEAIRVNGKITKYTLLDFWRWSVSDLISNATRGRLAEFIVGTAINYDFSHPREEWEAYDLLMDKEIKIEVKSAAYIQSWKQDKHSSIIFSIKPSKYWDPITHIESEVKRQADIYVFCHLKSKDITIDPLIMEQWDFYILSTYQLDKLNNIKKKISLKTLNDLTVPTTYSNLRNKIRETYYFMENKRLNDA